jgi:hypothetical protein
MIDGAKVQLFFKTANFCSFFFEYFF